MLEEIDFGYSVEEYVRYRIAAACKDNLAMKEIEEMVEPAAEKMKQAISGDEEKEWLFLKYQDCRDMREKERFMFSLKLGMEISIKMFKDLGLI